MVFPWRVIDFCRHFDIDISALSDSAADAAGPAVFSQLALRFHVPMDAASTRLRQQNIVDFYLEEEGITDGDEIALGVLIGIPLSCDRTELRKCVSQYLSNKRCFSTSAGNLDSNKGSTESLPLEDSDGGHSAEKYRKKLISVETSLFTIAVDLSRKETELQRYGSELDVRSRELKEAEDKFKQTMEVVKAKIHNNVVGLEKKRTTLLEDSESLEERKLSLEKSEALLENRLNDVLAAEKTLAAAQAQLKAEQEKLALEETALKQDKEQCALVAEGLLMREQRIKEAEEKLAKTKNELLAYEDLLRSPQA